MHHKLQFCWNVNWIHPLESTWSMIEKIKLSNFVSGREFLKVFGKKMGHGEIFLLEGIDKDLFIEYFNVNLNNYKSYLIGLSKFYGKNTKRIEFDFVPTLRYCELCIKENFHSFLHQFIGIETCPFHDTKLNMHCTRCNKVVQYKVITKNNAFSCECGNYLPGERYLPIWNYWYSERQIINPIVIKWLEFIDINLFQINDK